MDLSEVSNCVDTPGDRSKSKTATWQGVKWLLTYTKKHIDKEGLLEFLESIKPVKESLVVHELGKQGTHKHTHAYVYFESRIQKRDASWADYDGVHPNIKRVRRTKLDRTRVLRYLAKESGDDKKLMKGIEDHELEIPTDNKGNERSQMTTVLGRYDNPFDAIIADGDLRNVRNYKELYELKEMHDNDDDDTGSEASDDLELYRWQQDLLDRLNRKPDRRKILWRWEPCGGWGKTTFANYLEDKHDAVVLESVGYKDVARIFYKLKYTKKWKGNVVVFDLRRQMSDWEGVYGVIESIKNGRITSGKYDSATVKFRRKFHVIVFANWPPDRRALSMDRWDEVRIDGRSRYENLEKGYPLGTFDCERRPPPTLE